MFSPHKENFGGKTRNEEKQIWYGQTEQVVVGSRVHVLVPGYDYTRAHITDNAREEYGGIKNGDGHDNV